MIQLARLRGIFANRAKSLPANDHGHETLLATDHSFVAKTEGQSFIINYRDAAGHESLRRISVWAIRAADDGVPILVARCHERKATRYFRIDRVLAVADFDGVLQEPLSQFWLDTFGLIWPSNSIVEKAAAHGAGSRAAQV